MIYLNIEPGEVCTYVCVTSNLNTFACMIDELESH